MVLSYTTQYLISNVQPGFGLYSWQSIAQILAKLHLESSNQPFPLVFLPPLFTESRGSLAALIELLKRQG